MGMQNNFLVGCYFQVNDPKSKIDLAKTLEEDFEESLYVVPSYSFAQNRTLICSNHPKDMISIYDPQDGEVHCLDDLDIQKEKLRFERKFQKAYEFLKENYKDVKVRYGVICYFA